MQTRRGSPPQARDTAAGEAAGESALAREGAARLAAGHREADAPGKEAEATPNVRLPSCYALATYLNYCSPLAHPLVDPRTSPVCLITKDPQREYKDLLEANNIKFISRVVGVTKLKGKFKPFEARRLLLKENDLFLADERVVPLLPGLLGKKFFEAKKRVCRLRSCLGSY